MFSLAPLASLRTKPVWPRTIANISQNRLENGEAMALTARFLSRITFKLVCHSLKELPCGSEIGSEDSKWVVTLRSKQKNCNLFTAWGSEVSIPVWEMSGGFLWDCGLEVRIWDVAVCNESGVDCSDE